jgi:hypothetical protein
MSSVLERAGCHEVSLRATYQQMRARIDTRLILVDRLPEASELERERVISVHAALKKRRRSKATGKRVDSSVRVCLTGACSGLRARLS